MALKESSKLQAKKYRRETGRFLAEGARVIQEGLRSAWPCLALYYMNDAALKEFKLPAGIKLHQVTEKEFRRLSATVTPQGVVAEFAAPAEEPALPASGGVLYLDAVQDPGNVGVLLRTALGAGVRTVVIGPGTGDPFNPKAVRASAGALFHLRIMTDVAGRPQLQAARSAGFKILGAVSRGGTEAGRLTPPEKWVLVLGNEGQGLSADIGNSLDSRLTIAMDRTLESLNVAVSAGILMFKLCKRI
jgi:RNA methyltransferase, TrmH family